MHAGQITAWKKQLLEGAAGLFEDGRSKRAIEDATNGEELYKQIGRLKMEVEWLKKSCRVQLKDLGDASNRNTSGSRSRGVAISMDGRGRAIDNVIIKRLWRSVKYKEVYLRDYMDGWPAEASLAAYFRFYNEERIDQALGYRTPWAVYREQGSCDGQPEGEKQIEIARNKMIAG